MIQEALEAQLKADIVLLSSEFPSLIKEGGALRPIIRKDKNNAICIVFPGGREADVAEFSKLKEFADANCYKFHEDADTGVQGLELFYYYLEDQVNML